MVGCFVLYQQYDDGARGPVFAQGDMSIVVLKVRAMRLLAKPDPSHPLGVFYVGAEKDVYVIDFVLDP